MSGVELCLPLGRSCGVSNTPNNMTIYKRIEQNEVDTLKKLIQVFDEVFENENPSIADDVYLQNLLKKPEFIAFVAMDNKEVVGGLTAYELPLYYSEKSEMYIYDIAIKPEFQRKGLGKKLLNALSKYCIQNNITEMFVEAHEEDTNAVNFYHNAGGQAEKVIHFKFIRPL